MGKISFKIGLIFFTFMLVLQMTLFFFLYNGLIERYVDDELKDLKSRGNAHRDLLEQNINHFTLNYITLLEARAETMVVVTNINDEIIASSDPINPSVTQVLKTHVNIDDRDGIVLKKNWQTDPYIATITPIVKGNQVAGFVYMFLHTNTIKSKIEPLSQYFVLVGLFSGVFTIITIFFLSQIITKPVLRMKEATEKMSKGELDVKVPVTGQDELSQLALSINTLASDLHSVKKARNEFLSSISHELQTPLTYLKGYADIANRDTIPEEERKKALNIIQDEAKRVSGLVKNLFDLAKMDQHKFDIDVRQTNLSTLIQNTGEKVLTMYKEKDIKLILKYPKNLMVNIDPIRFEQVLINLLDNARKYSPKGSMVKVEATENGKMIELIVADTGDGIPQNDLPHIFDRLYRVERSRARATGGHGLGLSIVKEVIEAHGGKIEAQSELGVGTTMKITLKK